MAAEDELTGIADALAALARQARDEDPGRDFLRDSLSAAFITLRLEAKTLIEDELGVINNFTMHLSNTKTPAGVEACRAAILAAVNHMRRRPAMRTRSPLAPPKPSFVDLSRLAELRMA